MVMEFVNGYSLRELLKREGRLAPNHVAVLGSQMCAGIAAAHTASIIHRDLKPENILIEVIDGRETARVFDFGIAKLLDREGLTRQGYVLVRQIICRPNRRVHSRSIRARISMRSA